MNESVRQRALRRIRRTAAHLAGPHDENGLEINPTSGYVKSGKNSVAGTLAASAGAVDLIASLVYWRTGRRPNVRLLSWMLKSTSFVLWLKGPKPKDMVFKAMPTSRSTYIKSLLGPVATLVAVDPSPRLSCTVPATMFDQGKLATYQSVCAIKGDKRYLPVLFPHVATEGMLLEILAHPSFPCSMHTIDLLHCEATMHRLIPCDETLRLSMMLVDCVPDRNAFVSHTRAYASDGILVWECVATYGERSSYRFDNPPPLSGQQVQLTTVTSHMGFDYNDLTSLPDWHSLAKPVLVRALNRKEAKDYVAVTMLAGRALDALLQKKHVPIAPYCVSIDFLSRIHLPATLKTFVGQVGSVDEGSGDVAFECVARDPYTQHETPALRGILSPVQG